jgi:hypothetical protein
VVGVYVQSLTTVPAGAFVLHPKKVIATREAVRILMAERLA